MPVTAVLGRVRLARPGRARPDAGVVVDGRPTDGSPRSRGRAGPRRGGATVAARTDPARAGQRPLARLPPGAARAHPRRPGHVLDLAGAHVRRSPAGSTPTRYLALARATYAEMALAGITCVGEFHYLHHAPGRRAVRRPERDGARADRGGAPRRASGSPCSTRSTSPPLWTASRWPGRSSGSATARSTPGPSGSTRLTTAPHAIDRRGRALGPRRAGRRARPGSPSRRRRPAGPRAPVRAAGRERGLPGRARPHPDRAAATTHGLLGPRVTAVHATHLTDDGPHAAGRQPDRGLLLPDHRARPGRRHRAGPGAGRRRAPAVPRLRQPRRHRPVRGGARRSSWTSGCATEQRGHFDAGRTAHRGDRGRARRAGLARRRRASRAGARADLVTVRLGHGPRTAGFDDPRRPRVAVRGHGRPT